tara:strand:- start:724 stop:1371 length:648 start_codon:yes stop_codon:yes gene_type:complete
LIKYTPRLHNALLKDIDEKIKSEILNLINNATSNDKARSQLLNGLHELYAYLINMNDRARKILFSQEKALKTVPYNLYDKGIKDLLNQVPLCEFLDLDIDHIKSKHKEVKAQLKLVKDMGKTTDRKILYSIFGQIWSILSEIDYKKPEQIKFIHKFCVIAKFWNFGKRQFLNMDRPPPDEISISKRKEIDVIEKWYEKSKPYMSSIPGELKSSKT